MLKASGELRLDAKTSFVLFFGVLLELGLVKVAIFLGKCLRGRLIFGGD